jgi:autotransporter-associated beta strand protein
VAGNVGVARGRAGGLPIGAEINNTGQLDIAGVISGPAAGSLTKSGSGTLILSGSNTYAGTTTIVGGTLKAGHVDGLGSSVGGTVVQSNAVLDLNGQAIGAEAVTLNGFGISSSGALINSSGTAASLAGNITLASLASIGGSGIEHRHGQRRDHAQR